MHMMVLVHYDITAAFVMTAVPTYFLSIKKQFLSQLSQFSRLQTLICLFYKSARRPNPVFLMWSVKGKEAESKQGSYSESTMTVCLEFRVAGCALVLMHPGLRGQWIFFFFGLCPSEMEVNQFCMSVY